MNTPALPSLEGRDIVVPFIHNPGKGGNAVGLPHGAFGFQVGLSKVLYERTPDGYGTVDPNHPLDFSHSQPPVQIPENASWDDHQIISFHARGHLAQVLGADLLEAGWRFYPTTAVTRSRFVRPDVKIAIQEGRLTPDGTVLEQDGTLNVTDINIDPVWRMTEVAKRLGFEVKDFRTRLAKAVQNPQIAKNPSVEYLLPPVDGPNVHVFGDLSKVTDPATQIHARSHDYCRDGDNWAARCTCAPYKTFAIEEMIKAAQQGGIGILVMNPEEGRGFGSVIKHLVYNVREQHPNGDRSDRYWEATRQIIGGVDARFDWSKSDVFRWLLPHRRIDRWYSESHHKRSWLERGGIDIVQTVDLPEDRIPVWAQVEMGAKRASGYGSNGNGH
jgi:GTP cyclohydrolase II